jgi:TPR repeat protein
MMADMRHARWFLSAALVLLLPSAALAQFYDLDGAYRCLTTPDAACEKDLRDQPRPAPPSPGGPTLEQVIAKVRADSLGPREIDFLEKRAAANDPRAVEVLAWCKLNGIGMPADPLAAFWLYRTAAGLGVANARQNQIAIYENRLTPDQRQQVLLREQSR